MDLYAGIAMDVKNNNYLQDLYVGIAMDVKKQQLLRDLYTSIAMDVKTNNYYETYMQILHI